MLFSIYALEVLKIIRRIKCPLLARIVKSSLNSSMFPQILLIGHVVPIFKSDDRKEVGNYRTVTVLPISMKNYE